MTPVTHETLAQALERQREGLLPCVHCGFCLAVCPTYRRLGDEADSPRGRLHLMGAVVEGRLPADAPAFRRHIDRCLGCRACEPACPSGVEYGHLLEQARALSAAAAPPPLPTRLLLGVFTGGSAQRAFMAVGRLLRAGGMAGLLARVLRGLPGLRGAALGLGMLDASRGWDGLRGVSPPPGAGAGSPEAAPGSPEGASGSLEGASGSPEAAPGSLPAAGQRVALLEGCVQKGLFARVNAATRRVLEVHGYEVVEAPGQGCCGALHAHAGDLESAQAMGERNAAAFAASGVDWVVVNAAGCGAAMKERAAGPRVADVSELLAAVGVRTGAPLPISVAWDHPCHLLHAQGLRSEPLALLAAIPELEVRVVEGAEECCGGAGIYALTHPELGGEIGTDKARSVREAEATVVATPNPGCIMQIGAFLRLEGDAAPVLHPVELLDESYRRAGLYDGYE